MYQSFEAIVDKGKIKPLEKVHLKDSAKVLVTIIDETECSQEDYRKLKKLISRDRSEKKITSYHSFEAAKEHLRRIRRDEYEGTELTC